MQDRDLFDPDAARKNVYESVLSAASGIEPVETDRYILRLSDVRYDENDDEEKNPDKYSPEQQKAAIYGKQTVGRRLRGTWELLDKTTSKPIARSTKLLAVVPRVNEDGTLIYRGSRYAIMNQTRMKPGIFTRRKKSGELEAYVNVKPGTEANHRYVMDPKTGIYYLEWKQSRIPLSEVLPILGVDEKQMEAVWGKDIARANLQKRDPKAVDKLYSMVVPPYQQDPRADYPTKRWQIRQQFERMELDPWSTRKTLGQEVPKIDGQAVLLATRKVLGVSRGEQKQDDRDHLAFQTFHAIEDTLAERIARDKNRIQKKWLRQAAREGSLDKLPNRLLQEQIEAAVFSSGLGVIPDYANPLDAYERMMRVSKLGEGGIPSTDATPLESRDVHPSQHLFVDGSQTVESLKIGVDSTLTRSARRGKDGKIYTPLRNAKTGQIEYLSPEDLSDKTIAISKPGAEIEGLVGVIRDGEETFVLPEEVDYFVDRPDSRLFSPTASLIALRSAMAPHRLAMGSRMLSQAVPLVEPDPFLVRSAYVMPDGERIDTVQEFGRRVGALYSDVSGEVIDVSPTHLKIKTQAGVVTKPLANYFPLGSKTALHHTPLIKKGDRVRPGMLLARSNFTTDKGEFAVSKNARVAFMPWGDNFEDAFVVSESFANKMKSQQLYRERLDAAPNLIVDKKKFLGALPGTYEKSQLEKLDETGVVKPGQIINRGDPVILAFNTKFSEGGRVHRKGKKTAVDSSVVWHHTDPGRVVDVFRDKKGNIVVAAETVSPLKDGDKIASLFGDKGVVRVVPDAEMPVDESGEPVDIVASDLGLISRENPARAFQAILGKIASKTRKPYLIDDFSDDNYAEFVKRELTRHGVRDKETLVNPKTGQPIRDVAVGVLPMLRLVHLSEAKAHARSLGRYTSEGTPARGSDEDSQAKRLSNQELHALVAHGATEFIREGRLLRGQANPEYWARYLSGQNPLPPKIPFVYEKYLGYLRGMGIDPVEDPDTSNLNVFLMNDRDVSRLASSKEIKNTETVDFLKNQRPIKGGLFDPEIFGEDGMRWGMIRLPLKIPNPVMEDPIRSLMGVTRKEYRDILAGRKDFEGYGSGPAAVEKFLSQLDITAEMRKAAAKSKDPRVTQRDAAIKRLRYLRGLYEREIDPKDLMIRNVPIIPPKMRPIAVLQSTGAPIIDGMNLLYRDLFETVSAYNELKQLKADPSRLATTIYDATQAVFGLRKPIDPELQKKEVVGLLGKLVGPGSPKYNYVNRKLLSGPVDMVARGVALPNTRLKLDEVAIPEEQAWDLYKVPIIRRFTRRGFRLDEAVKAVEHRTPEARKYLLEAMEEHPVVATRAPVLHKYGVLAFKPKLTSGHTLELNPLVHEGFGLDHDGDTMNFHVLMRDETVQEAKEKLLPSRSLISPRDFKSPVFVPRQDHALGLYLASTRRDNKRRAVIFRSKDDVRKALLRGDITPDTPVKVIS
ncbi:MAG: hypothetical protein KatS3mg109_0134 [Pirellulaceae bacterium]|nr:MAG: hypothetical protein KatS3mg109_0134 [Pirellulaceae bacterium]